MRRTPTRGNQHGYGSSYKKQKRYGALEIMRRERKRPNYYNIYVDLLCDIIDKENSTYEDIIEKRMEGYHDQGVSVDHEE